MPAKSLTGTKSVPAHQFCWNKRDQVQNAVMGLSTTVLNLEDSTWTNKNRGRGLTLQNACLAPIPALTSSQHSLNCLRLQSM